LAKRKFGSPRSRRIAARGRFLTTAALIIVSILVGLAGIELTIAWLQPITTAYRWDPHTNYRLRPDLDIAFATGEFTTHIRTNADGLRDEPWDPAEARPVIVLVGDSFVFGHGVEASETFGAGLQRRFGTAARVVNSGHPGWDTWRELAWLRAEGPRFRPSVVLVGFVLNDVLANSGEFRFAPTATGWLRHLPFPAVGAMLEYVLSDPTFVLFRLGFDVPHGRIDHLACLREEACERGWTATQTALAEMVAEIRRQGATPLLVHLPTRPETSPDETVPPYRPDGALRRLETIAKALGIGFQSLAMEPAAFFPRDGHWNRSGHEAAAERLAPVIAGLLSADRKATP
jgi:hypothetical protein